MESRSKASKAWAFVDDQERKRAPDFTLPLLACFEQILLHKIGVKV